VRLPQRVVVDPILKPVAKTGRDLLDSSSNFGEVAERCFAVDVPDVVQVDIDGKPSEIEIKEVESRSALEDKLSSEIGMFVEFGQQFAEAENLLKNFSGKACVRGEFADLCWCEFHVCTELVREGESVSGTMSFHVGTQRWPGRLSAR